MKTKQLTRLFVPVILAFVLAFSGLFLVLATKGIASASVSDAIASYQSEYKIGTEISIPDAYFTDGGSQVKATKVVYCPDGTSYSVNKFTPATMGEYTVEYFTMTDSGEYLSQTTQFYVYSDLCEVVGRDNVATYGAHPLTPNTNGIMVSLNSNGEFKYNNVIDLNKLGGASPFISMYMTPETLKEADAEEFTVKLTDIYDSSNYVRIKVTCTRDARAYGHNVAYIQAGAAFQPTTGYERAWNKLHKNNIYGFGQNFSFFGCDSSGVTTEEFLTAKNATGQLQLFLNHETKQVLTQGSTAGDREIIDLDNPAHFSELWNGFTTGEVFLSITAKGLKKSHINFVITDIAGTDISASRLVDDKAPFVDVDTLDYDGKNLPRAVVGQPYPVFSSKAIDPYSGELKTRVKVYQNYGSPAQSMVSVIDGKFTPNAPGNYYVVYSAVDYSGNVGETVHVVGCDKTGKEINVNVGTEDRVVASNVGEVITLPAVTTSGGSGNITVVPNVKDASGKDVEITKNTFQPLSAGKYTVEFVATDFASTKKSYSYDLVVSLSNKPIFERGVEFVKYFIAGTEYELPELKAYDFSNGKAETAVSIKVTDDDGERTLGTDRKVTFNVEELGAMKDVCVKYVASNSNGLTEKEYTIKVINVRRLVEGNKRLDVSKYFYSEDATVKAAENDIELISTKNSSVEFINPLIASGFSFNFFTVNAANTLGTMKIVLTDIQKTDKQVVVELSKNKSGATNAVINGVGPYEIDVNYNNGEFNFGYDLLERKITFDGTNYVTLSQWADGTAFDGFPSGKVYMTVQFEDVTDKAIVKVRKINMQEFKEGVLMDRVNPRMYVPNEGSRSRRINEVVTVYPAIVADVLDPNAPATVSVKGEGGKVITAIDGTVLNNVPADREYQFILEEYGVYRISYNTEDDSVNKSGLPIVINVVDHEAPIITLTQNNPTTVKKGSSVGLASFIATDNSTDAEKITLCCFVVRPCGLIFTVNMKDSNSFVATETGTYVLRYFAQDETGNIAFVDYELKVTE